MVDLISKLQRTIFKSSFNFFLSYHFFLSSGILSLDSLIAWLIRISFLFCYISFVSISFRDVFRSTCSNVHCNVSCKIFYSISICRKISFCINFYNYADFIIVNVRTNNTFCSNSTRFLIKSCLSFSFRIFLSFVNVPTCFF